jgi:hypothetical protein
MKTILLVAVLGFVAPLTPAFACEMQKEANYTPVVVAPEQTTADSATTQSESAATVDSVTKTADEPATSAPATLAADIR